MITTSDQYQEHLALLKNLNAPRYAILNPNETLYKIDLTTREIEVPEFLGVLEDYRSETIYFEVDRYFDYMDLAQTACVIQYINAAGKAGIYAIPFYDINTLSEQNKIILPWNLSGLVSEAAGTIQFSFFFYSIEQKIEDGEYNYIYNYRLNTKMVKSKILNGLAISTLLNKNLQMDNLPPKDYSELDAWLYLNARLNQVENWQSNLYWTVLD